MQIRSESKYVRMSPRKVRLVAHAVRRLSLDQALLFLDRVDKKAAGPIKKTLVSAVANAQNNHNQEKSNLYIDSVQVNEGPMFKRWRAASRGMAHGYVKKTSHIEITLGVKKQTGKKKKEETNITKTDQSKKSLEENDKKTTKKKENETKPKLEVGPKKEKQQGRISGLKGRFVKKAGNRTTNK